MTDPIRIPIARPSDPRPIDPGPIGPGPIGPGPSDSGPSDPGFRDSRLSASGQLIEGRRRTGAGVGA
jgi:hypothetical protein